MGIMIELRDYYPGQHSENAINVQDEVYLWLREARRQEANARRRHAYHKAYYSLDRGDAIERYALDKIITPEEILERRDETASVRAALRILSKKQARRIYLYYYIGKSKSEIAREEGVTESSVFESIDRGLQKMRRYLLNSQFLPNKTGKISPDR